MMLFAPPTRVRRGPGRVLGAALPLLAVCLFGFAMPAAAQYQLLTFDLTQSSSVSLLGGTIVTPPDGTLTVGTLTLQLPSSGPGMATPGASVLLDDFALAGSVSKVIPGQAQISGPFSADQVGPVSGTLAPGLDSIDFTGQDLVVDLDVNLGCVGAGCGLLGFPVVDVGASIFELGVLSAFDLDQLGSARLEATVDLEIDGVLGTLDLVAIESNRVFVPEPGTAVLLGAALLLLGRQRAHTRKRA